MFPWTIMILPRESIYMIEFLRQQFTPPNEKSTNIIYYIPTNGWRPEICPVLSIFILVVTAEEKGSNNTATTPPQTRVSTINQSYLHKPRACCGEIRRNASTNLDNTECDLSVTTRLLPLAESCEKTGKLISKNNMDWLTSSSDWNSLCKVVQDSNYCTWKVTGQTDLDSQSPNDKLLTGMISWTSTL